VNAPIEWLLEGERWSAWEDWEFGQKRVPSRWLTFLAWRIIMRIQSA